MIQTLIKFAQGMDQVIHGVNKYNKLALYNLPLSLQILAINFLITFIGWLSLSFIGKRLLTIFDNLLKKIPILRTIYSAIGQMTDTFTSSDSKKNNVVLV